MTIAETWEQFAQVVDMMFAEDPKRCRVTVSYQPAQGVLVLKVTNDHVTVKYKTEHAQDVKKLEKLTSQLMRQLVSK
ncbi:hypothetical protein BOX15_Mlig017455g2 [Macrostomum lignano]|uniref:Signal recognition particle 9 kDa protein n=1 Tax=Macrostomum lignano TaxID=282301 RepID=A0A267GJT5_9PLAT|nr:hypothetical protein BOX15_Mlig005349g2 [Macrostomum lignano]PAA87418.1 hypothetical protein BOX15_Mlig026507g2 [Macrostomum lignano]PAA90666.1 hypothetical protein BOX15_Mlig017455g2 [Macrostomum lignano]